METSLRLSGVLDFGCIEAEGKGDTSMSVPSTVVPRVEEARERERELDRELDREVARELARRGFGRGLGGASTSSSKATWYSATTSSSIVFLTFWTFFEDFADVLDLTLLPGCLLLGRRVEDLVPGGWYSWSEDEAIGVVGGLDLERARFVGSETLSMWVKNGQGPFLA